MTVTHVTEPCRRLQPPLDALGMAPRPRCNKPEAFRAGPASYAACNQRPGERFGAPRAPHEPA